MGTGRDNPFQTGGIPNSIAAPRPAAPRAPRGDDYGPGGGGAADPYGGDPQGDTDPAFADPDYWPDTELDLDAPAYPAGSAYPAPTESPLVHGFNALAAFFGGGSRPAGGSGRSPSPSRAGFGSAARSPVSNATRDPAPGRRSCCTGRRR